MSGLRVLVAGHQYTNPTYRPKLHELERQGVQLGLLAPRCWRAVELGEMLRLDLAKGRVAVYPGSIAFNGRVNAFFYSPASVLRPFRRFRPTVVHIEQELHSISALQIATMAKIVGARVTALGPRIDVPPRLRPIQARIRDVVLHRLVDVIISGSAGGEQLVRRWGYRGAVDIQPAWGVDTNLFRPAPRPARSDVFRVGFVGRLVAEKGVDLLLRAAARLDAQGRRVEVVVAGSGPLDRELEQLARSLCVRARFLGNVEPRRVPEVIREMDVLVLPSRTVPTWKEMFGIVLIQAMAMGVPVVGSSCGAIPEVVGRPDLIVPEGDAEALANRIGGLMDDPDWCRAVGAHGISRTQKHYSFACVARNLRRVWEELPA